MFQRDIIFELEKWVSKANRKPLIIRGARQVGKTTVINQFSSLFEQYIYLNLELPEDKKPFEEFETFDTLLETLFFIKNKLLAKRGKTLIFIDEIQEVPAALQQLRYFFEQAPDVAVIGAGSMLESLFNPVISFPVGRVEYLVIHPVSFPEFLGAMHETSALTYLKKVPIAKFAEDKLMKLFRTYCLIGGMPEVVAQYVEAKDLTALKTTYESLLVSYLDDVEKYANSSAQVEYIRHAIRASFAEAGRRIKYQGFGNSSYKSREMGEALRTLEKALLIHLVFPQTSPVLPLLPDQNKSPRLHVLDTGMLNYFVGIQQELLGTQDLSTVYQGFMIEHIMGQELLARQYSALHGLNFWVREKSGTSAEIDYLFVYEGKLIPIEVKSGAEGRLKSLHLFMDLAPHDMAVRFFAGEVSISTITTSSEKKYYLLNLPYFLISQIEGYLKWFETQVAEMKEKDTK
ncbi:ATP-binding protein [Chitinophaga sp. sic0106]|uniref:ATP-binding protein n=1 Tax=Chitinophaga sp. sic0106 TaxID=2854785 RepID=UPI001C453FE0|nr:AAA family ATPase [Chitinophaga sp. sic0106]MBV7533036.1 AAA family ATPase [Chitinophaga sp. sic0106]